MSNYPAIYFALESYSTGKDKLMGRQAAGEGFLKGFVEHFAPKELELLMHTPAETSQAQKLLRSHYNVANTRCYGLSHLEQLAAKTLYIPSPGLSEFAQHRVRISERQFCLSGVTHTTASHRVMQSISELLTEPVRPWDSLICTSEAVKQSVEVILAEQKEYLRWKVGATRFELPELPVIPLGVDIQRYTKTISNARQQLNIGENDIVVLFVGRLSFHAKAHPQPMFMALQAVAESQPQRKIHLIQCGWYANTAIKDAFAQSAEYFSPNVVVHHLDGRDKQNVTLAWSAADIFMSLSDNIQETFGLTPIEAMARGLPVLVSDWNGYKDTVVHGETGFRVPTTQPSPGPIGEELARKYADGSLNYDKYCGYSCELVGVDVPQTIHYLGLLVNDPQLRKTMGHSGLKRVKSKYDWSVVMAQYEYLWQQQDYTRRIHKESFSALPKKNMAHQLDPFLTFAHYASHSLDVEVELLLNETLDIKKFKQVKNLGVHSFANTFLPTEEEWLSVKVGIESLQAENTPLVISEILSRVDTLSAHRVQICIAWMLKIGWLSVAALPTLGS